MIARKRDSVVIVVLILLGLASGAALLVAWRSIAAVIAHNQGGRL